MRKYILTILLLLLPAFFVNASCFETLWVMSQDNYDGTCSCMRWYTMVPKTFWWGYQCISKSTHCRDTYWSFIRYNSLTDSCECSYWYTMVPKTYWSWYQCISYDSFCRDKYWSFIRYNSLSDSCECNAWYVFKKNISWNISCVSWDSACHDQLWYNSSYNALSDNCVCDDWYTIRDWQCQKKAYTTYWVMKELKNDTAIVVFKKPNRLTESYYEIDFWLWCRDVDDYVWEVIVLNLMYDERLNYWDYLVLPESKDFNWDAQHCKITSYDEIDDDDSLYSCEELFWRYSYQVSKWKCWCIDWYEFINDICEEIEDDNQDNNNSYYLPTNSFAANTYSSTPPNNNEIDLAIKWMYENELTKFNNKDLFMIGSELTREQASKFFVQFAIEILWKQIDVNKSSNFNDMLDADPTLTAFIWASSNLWLFQWSNWYFYPHKKLTQAQAITVLIRAKDGFLNEDNELWYNDYYRAASIYWILDWLWFELNTLDQINITRGDMAILLYRLSKTMSN